MVAYALQGTKYGKGDNEIGIRSRGSWDNLRFLDPVPSHGPLIRRMVRVGAVELFYPLHDGIYWDKSGSYSGRTSLRMWLLKHWASFRYMFKIQPLDQVRNYFGEKVALYFAFMGFYTNWLTVLSLVGIAVMIFGLLDFNDSTYVNELCNLNYTMCPR